MFPNGELTTYSLRIAPRAERDIETGFDWFREGDDERIAREWRDGLFAEFATLATLPRRCPLPENTTFRSEVRKMVYRRSHFSVAYILFYRVMDNSPDGPLVTLLHVRHGAARPLARAETREIDSQH